MNEPTLVVMAAGLGSRYGGLKQMDPVTAEGEIIIDFSLYDAMLAGFKKVVFIIKKEIEQDFRALIDGKSGRHFETEYVFQDLSDVPAGYKIPKERVKPWGTCHAVMSCRGVLDGPFAVINADDFYGAGAFQMIHDYLEQAEDRNGTLALSMVAYPLENTLTEHGTVARGVCGVNEKNELEEIAERKKIIRRDSKIMYTLNDDAWIEIPKNTVASMNFWGFTRGLLAELEAGFPVFLDNLQKYGPLTAEYLLPTMVGELISAGKAKVHVLKSTDRWYGVTYQEDRAFVKAGLQSLKDKGVYPEKLWR
ncbi:MAG: nucleotidyltransferase [Clostridiales Family XIII bacterium]|jgi:hypothetical protein|nr:nucleotidyltransferase [Clostridiales Family XIII bacterium]